MPSATHRTRKTPRKGTSISFYVIWKAGRQAGFSLLDDVGTRKKQDDDAENNAVPAETAKIVMTDKP